MASIQMITSKKKEVQVQGEHGETKTVVVRVWNETVANLTLMAMGCSAPEILLGIVEVVGKGFEADELGPGVAVGSAAINLFVVIGLCNLFIPRGEMRRIKRVSVFLTNAIWSLFSYCWLFIIVQVSSPGVVEVWEGLVTFLLFPVTVLSAYLADRHVSIYDYLSKTYGMGRHGLIVEMTTDEVKQIETDFNFKQFDEEKADEEVRDFEDHRRAFLLSMKNLRRKHSIGDPYQLELMAAKELFQRGTQSKAFYRRLSTMMLSGLSTRITGTLRAKRPELDLRSLYAEFTTEDAPESNPEKNPQGSRVFFRPGHFTVMENVGEFSARVVREGGDLNQQILVDYATEDGGALAHRDYVPLYDTLVFEPGEASKTITVNIIEDNIYEGDQLFYIRLFNIRVNKFAERRFTRGDIAEDAYRMTTLMNEDPNYLSSISEIEEYPPQYADHNRLYPPPPAELVCDSVFDGEAIEMHSVDPALPSIVVNFDDIQSCPCPQVKNPSSNKACLVCPSLATVMILDDDHQVCST